MRDAPSKDVSIDIPASPALSSNLASCLARGRRPTHCTKAKTETSRREAGAQRVRTGPEIGACGESGRGARRRTSLPSLGPIPAPQGTGLSCQWRGGRRRRTRPPLAGRPGRGERRRANRVPRRPDGTAGNAGVVPREATQLSSLRGGGFLIFAGSVWRRLAIR